MWYFMSKWRLFQHCTTSNLIAVIALKNTFSNELNSGSFTLALW
jgi:hypothetical protein